MRTHSVKPDGLEKNWVIVDSKDRSLGRVASQIAYLLRGKHKPTFVPHLDCGDNVIVINAAKAKLTANKAETKIYYHHTGFVGGIKARAAKDIAPDQLLYNAVKGMLPKNKLSREVIKNLKVYVGEEHPHEAQKPVPAPSRLVAGE